MSVATRSASWTAVALAFLASRARLARTRSSTVASSGPVGACCFFASGLLIHSIVCAMLVCPPGHRSAFVTDAVIENLRRPNAAWWCPSCTVQCGPRRDRWGTQRHADRLGCAALWADILTGTRATASWLSRPSESPLRRSGGPARRCRRRPRARRRLRAGWRRPRPSPCRGWTRSGSGTRPDRPRRSTPASAA